MWFTTFVIGSSVGGAQPDDSHVLDAGGDRILERTFVPSEERKVGEVRLIRRGEAEVVQTLLYTKLLRKVVGEIRKKELANWPPGRTGHDDAVRYADALRDVQKALWKRLPQDKRMHDRRQYMLIELVLAPNDARVLIGAFEMVSRDGMAQVARREVMANLPLSREYIERNQRLIIADSFGVDGAPVSPSSESISPTPAHPLR